MGAAPPNSPGRLLVVIAGAVMVLAGVRLFAVDPRRARLPGLLA